MSLQIENIKDLAEKAAQTAGCELYDFVVVSLNNEKNIRLYIDKSPSVDIEDCAQVSRLFNESLENLDANFFQHCSLEVSSPGLERELKNAKHYRAVVGKKVQIKLTQPIGEFGFSAVSFSNAKNLAATLKNVPNDQQIEVLFEGEEVNLPIEKIQKAHLIFEFEKPKPKKGSR